MISLELNNIINNDDYIKKSYTFNNVEYTIIKYDKNKIKIT